jgi:hypothetical protein
MVFPGTSEMLPNGFQYGTLRQSPWFPAPFHVIIAQNKLMRNPRFLQAYPPTIEHGFDTCPRCRDTDPEFRISASIAGDLMSDSAPGKRRPHGNPCTEGNEVPHPLSVLV